MSEGVRWSHARDCPRKAVYGARQPSADREWSDREERLLMRGRRVETDIADMIEKRYGEGSIIRQKAVPWPTPPADPLGVLHGDVFIIAERLPVEILSSRDPSRQLVESKLLQLAGQVHFDPDADGRGRLMIVDPTDYSTETYPFTLDPGWRARVEERAAQVAAGLAGNMPDRVCKKPSNAIGHFCRYADTCFSGWQAPTRPELEADPKLRELVHALYATQRGEREAKARVEEWAAERRRIQGELADELEPGTYAVDGYEVTRQHQRRQTLSRTRARALGVPDHMLDEASNVSEFDVWRIKRTLLADELEPADVDEELDEVPF